MTKRKLDTDHPSPSHDTKLTEAETKLYDRQIRLWGLKGQQALRNAKILAIGVTGLANEVLKNIVLAGVDTITIASKKMVKVGDLSAQFLLRQEKIGSNVYIGD